MDTPAPFMKDIKGTTEWTNYSGDVTAPAGAIYGLVGCIVGAVLVQHGLTILFSNRNKNSAALCIELAKRNK